MVPPRWSHFTHRGFRLSMSLEAPGPHLIRKGAKGTATLRPHTSKYHNTQCCGALSWPQGLRLEGVAVLPCRMKRPPARESNALASHINRESRSGYVARHSSMAR